MSKIILFHYTFFQNLESIIDHGLRPSLASNGDAQWGDGHYFSNLSPDEIAQKTRYHVSYALFKTPWMWGGQPPLPPIGWLEVSLDAGAIQRVAPLFGKQFKQRSIFLLENTKIFNVNLVLNRIGGPLAFQSSPSGHQ